MTPVAHALPPGSSARDVERAAELLESWSLAPAFRV